VTEPFQLANVALGFLGLAVASFTDVRNRTVPNLLVAALLVFAVAYHALMGSLALMLYGIAVALAIGLALYLLEALASGDAKLFVAIGALVPALPWLQFLPFPLLLALATIAVAGIYAAILALRYGGMFRETKGVGELAEGDVPVRRFAVKGGRAREITAPKPLGWLLDPGSALGGLRELYGAMRDSDCVIGLGADGLSTGEIAVLKRLAAKGRIPRRLELRRTIPLVPSFLVAFALVVLATYYIYGMR